MKEVILTTNTRLSKDTVATLTRMTAEKFGTENVVHVTDDRIIGGFTIRSEGVFYDMSIASQISRLKNSLTDDGEADK